MAENKTTLLDEKYLVSVVVPCYNVEKYIDECLGSIVNQTYRNLQVILIDDGSTDKTGELCKVWAEKDSRIEYYYQENKGLSEARNTGNTKVKGDFFTYVDSDDALTENFVEVMLSKLLEYDADFSCCQYLRGAEFNLESVMPQDVISEDLLITDYIDYFGRVYNSNRFAGFAIKATQKLCRSSLIDLFHFPARKINEDARIATTVYTKCKRMLFIPDCLYFYRDNPVSIMNTVNDKLILSETEWKVQHYEYWETQGQKHLLALISREICYYINAHWKVASDDARRILMPIYKKARRWTIFNGKSRLRTRVKNIVMVHPVMGKWLFFKSFWK